MHDLKSKHAQTFKELEDGNISVTQNKVHFFVDGRWSWEGITKQNDESKINQDWLEIPEMSLQENDSLWLLYGLSRLSGLLRNNSTDEQKPI